MARYKRILSNKKRRGKGVPLLLRGRSEIWREERGLQRILRVKQDPKGCRCDKDI